MVVVAVVVVVVVAAMVAVTVVVVAAVVVVVVVGGKLHHPVAPCPFLPQRMTCIVQESNVTLVKNHCYSCSNQEKKLLRASEI
jgi:hypothetical protein